MDIYRFLDCFQKYDSIYGSLLFHIISTAPGFDASFVTDDDAKRDSVEIVEPGVKYNIIEEINTIIRKVPRRQPV